MPITKPTPTKIEGLAGDIWVRQVSTREYVTIADLCVGLDKKTQQDQLDGLARICVIACCDADGNPVFADSEAVFDEPLSTLHACVDAVLTLHGMDKAPPKP